MLEQLRDQREKSLWSSPVLQTLLNNYTNYNHNDIESPLDASSNAKLSFPSTEYTTGSGSDRYPYGSHRTTTSRRMRHEMDHEQNLRDPLDDDRRNHRQHREGSVKRGQFTRSLSNNEAPTEEKNGISFDCTIILRNIFKFYLFRWKFK